ncbi:MULTISPECIES: hypothetical protein [Rheinheimera]|uniref:hypothetical protein n=1 Tax=Rheinheimera TaxID=67575 RepID=UPI001050C607|nr:hypothetical protein [Rheinheimera sp. D18]QBL08734.1 hypothetical protein E0Z06_03985 [Rheinheimera sp. D18]
MLIDKLLVRRRIKVARLAEKSRKQQQCIQLESQLLKQRASEFIGTPPGLMLSFSAGCLFQLRHNSAVKTMRRLVGVQWLRWF